MVTDGEWLDAAHIEFFVMDAMGVIIDGVESARQTADGVEVIATAVTPEGEELVCSIDGGATFETVRARMDIPGGMIETYSEE